ncbi:MAG: flippase-like domain-containing protein [bacterium]
MTTKKLSIKKLFFTFCIIIICIIGIIAFLTTGPKTWQAISQMKLKYMIFAFILGVLTISLDGMILKILSLAAGIKVTFSYCLKTILFYLFLSSITPTISGGEPLMIYMLTQKDVPLGKATSIILIRGLLILSIIALAAPVIVYFHGEIVQNILLKNLFRYIAILLFFVLFFLAYAFFNPIKSEEIIHKICSWIERCKILAGYSEKLEKRLKIWIDDFSNCLKEFFKYKKKILLGTVILTTISLGTSYLIAYTVLEGLNYHLPVLQVVMVQFILYFLLYFTPTPGGTGVAEGGCYLIFSCSVPNHLLGIFIILWRFFTIYIWVVLGGLLITKTIGLDILEKISTPL